LRDQRVAAKRANFILLLGGGLFVVTFLAIFIATPIHNMVGLGRALWIVILIPLALAVAGVGTAIAFQWTVDRGSFDEPDIDDAKRKGDQ
jgi:cbb3-type cytochrome oxidase maturation protein